MPAEQPFERVEPLITPSSKEKSYRYKAFISYSRSADDRIAPILQKRLQQFGKRWYRLRAMRVFRDQTGLALTPGLLGAIERALDQSEYLVLLASPKAAQSQWVNQEVQYWLRHRSPETILIVWTEGQIAWDPGTGDFDWTVTDALPRCLEKAFVSMPNLGDLRWVKSDVDLSLRRPRFLEEIAKLRAALVQKPVEDIFDEDATEHRKTMRILRAALATLLVLTLASVGGFYLSFQAKETARRLALQREGELREAREREEARRRAEAEAKRRADEQRQSEADSEQLAQQAEALLNDDRELSILLALEGISKARTEKAERVLWRALLDVPTRTLLPTAPETGSATFSPDGKRIMTSTAEGLVQCWDALSASNLFTLTLGTSNSSPWLFCGYSGDGSRFVTAVIPESLSVGYFDGGGVQLHDGATGQVLARIADKYATGAALSPDGKTILTADFDGSPRLFDERGNLLHEFTGHESRIVSASFSKNGEWILTAGRDDVVQIWEARTRRSIAVLRTPKQIKLALFNPDATRVLTLGGDPEQSTDLRLWDWRNKPGGSIAEYPGHTGSIKDLAFSPDGKWLATASWDKTARIWETASGRCVHVLSSHQEPVVGIDFSPNSKWVVTASFDSTARVWEAATGEELMELGFNQSARMSAAFSPDGKRIITAMSEGAFPIYDSQILGGVNDLVTLAHARTERALTAEEKIKYLPKH